jgi:hypothetical protein
VAFEQGLDRRLQVVEQSLCFEHQVMVSALPTSR